MYRFTSLDCSALIHACQQTLLIVEQSNLQVLHPKKRAAAAAAAAETACVWPKRGRTAGSVITPQPQQLICIPFARPLASPAFTPALRKNGHRNYTTTTHVREKSKSIHFPPVLVPRLVVIVVAPQPISPEHTKKNAAPRHTKTRWPTRVCWSPLQLGREPWSVGALEDPAPPCARCRRVSLVRH